MSTHRYSLQSLLGDYWRSGAGLGATITMRAAVAHPDRVAATILISVEDIEDDTAKAAEIAFMDAFAERVRTAGDEVAAPGAVVVVLSQVLTVRVRQAVVDGDDEAHRS